MSVVNGISREPRTVKNAVMVVSCAAAVFFTNAVSGEAPPPAPVLEKREKPEETDAGIAASKRTFAISPGWTLLLSPATDLYPRYIADPRRSGFAVTYMHFPRTEIAEAGANRVGIRLGGSYGLVRIHPAGGPERGFQLDLGGNFLGQFDLDRALDNIGWDGLYHLSFTWGDGDGLALKLGTLHDSSHVGDEYAENTGRKRLKYTREELVLGISRAFGQAWRVYGEAGRAYHRSNKELMDLWRAQGGVEYESKKSLWGGRMCWYFAADSSFFEERDWHGNVSIHLGVVLPVDELGRRYRFGVEYYRGRSVLGEFFQDDETSVAIGIWLDL